MSIGDGTSASSRFFAMPATEERTSLVLRAVSSAAATVAKRRAAKTKTGTFPFFVDVAESARRADWKKGTVPSVAENARRRAREMGTVPFMALRPRVRARRAG